MADMDFDGCADRTMFFWLFGFYTAWMMGIAALAYQKLKGFDDYATHFVGRKDYGVFVMMLTMFASFISGNTITNGPNTASALGYCSFWIRPLYTYINMGWSWVAPRIRRLSVARQWNSYSDLIADRFRNPVLIGVTLIFPVMSLEAYIIAQFWALRALIPVVSDNMMHDDRMTLLLAIVVYICESFGGFDAVSYTDVIQGCIIIIALCIGPIYMSMKFGMLSGTVTFNCPGTWFEVLPDPDSNGTISKRRGCYAYKSPWNTLHPAGTSYSYYFKPLWPTYGVDASLYWNNVGIFCMNQFVLFLAYCCFPHVTCRLFASKSDFHCRKSCLGMILMSLVAGLPGLILGFFYAIHIERMYPAGTVTFGGILDFMMRQGGAPEFFACLAACGGLAGIMSTVDSSALAITNIVTKEIIVNGVFRVAPHLDTHRFMTVCERSSTGFCLVLALYMTVIFLASRVESDPLEAKLMMNRIGFYQFGFVAQSFPATMCILFKSQVNALPLILGDLASLIVLPSLSVAFFEQKYYSTNVPEGQPPNLWIHPTILSVLINGAVLLVTNAILPAGLANVGTIKSDKEPLSYEQILGIMSGTVECCHSKFGRAFMALFVLLTMPACPWYKAAFNGCDFSTYNAYNDWSMDNSLPKPPDCDPEGVSPCGSFPHFAGAMLGCFVCGFPAMIGIVASWVPDAKAGEATLEGGK